MPFFIPDLRGVREQIRDDMTASLRGARIVGNKALRVVADGQAGAARLLLKMLQNMTRQQLPDTAEDEWLARHGRLWLLNSDGSKGQKGATFARGSATITGVPGVFLDIGTELRGVVSYETLDEVIVGDAPTEVALRALDPGAAGNLNPGDIITFTSGVSGVDNQVTIVEMVGGTDVESNDDLRARILLRIQNPPMGGNPADFTQWALAVPGVTRAWCAPREQGMGTVTVRVMCDFLRASSGGFPSASDLAAVKDYIDTRRPVPSKDCFVLSPVPEPINFTVALESDSTAKRAAVTKEVTAMINEIAAPASSTATGELVPGRTIYNADVSEAIKRAVGSGFTLTMANHPMPFNGALAQLGTITWA